MANELFEKVPVHNAYFKLALPVVFSMVISLVYNMVDTWFIARTGNTDLIAGVSLGAPVFTLMIALAARSSPDCLGGNWMRTESGSAYSVFMRRLRAASLSLH